MSDCSYQARVRTGNLRVRVTHLYEFELGNSNFRAALNVASVTISRIIASDAAYDVSSVRSHPVEPFIRLSLNCALIRENLTLCY